MENVGEPASAPAAALTTPRRGKLAFRLVRSRLFALVAVNLAVIALVTAINPGFATPQNASVILINMVLESIVLAGTVLLLVAGRFDLSLDGVAALAAIVAGKLMADARVEPLWAVLVGFAIGLAVGLTNGFAIERLGMNPLMTTLATWWACTGAALGLTAGTSPFGFPDSFNFIGQGSLLGIRLLVWYALILIPAMAITLAFTKFGYHIYAAGGDRRAARLHGVNVELVGIVLYVLIALLAAFVGIVFAARIGSASPVAVDGMNLRVIAGAVIGGASLSGGAGSVVGGLLGLLLMHILSNAAIYVGISPYWQKALIGLVLLLAVAFDAFTKRPVDDVQQASLLRRIFCAR